MTQQNMDTQTRRAEQPSRSPEATFRHGAIGGSIWRQAGKNGDFFNFTLSRSFKSKDTGDSGYSPNFNERNADDLVSTINDCVGWIREKATDGQS